MAFAFLAINFQLLTTVCVKRLKRFFSSQNHFLVKYFCGPKKLQTLVKGYIYVNNFVNNVGLSQFRSQARER
jgi:hypothetical protein